MLPRPRSGRSLSLPDVNWVMMKSSIDSEKASSAAGEDPGEDQREGHPPERRPLVRAEVHGGFLEVAVEALHPGPDRDDDIADVEHHVGDEDASGSRAGRTGHQSAC